MKTDQIHIKDIQLSNAYELNCAINNINDTTLLGQFDVSKSEQKKILKNLVDDALSKNKVSFVQAFVPSQGNKKFVDIEVLQTEMLAYLSTIDQKTKSAIVKSILQNQPLDTDNSLRKRIKNNNLVARLIIDFYAKRDLSKLLNYLDYISVRPRQIKNEIQGLIELIGKRPIQSFLETGTSAGGTFLLLSKFIKSSAIIATIDIKQRNGKKLKGIFGNRKNTHIIEGSSASSEIFNDIKTIFMHNIDFLFIDGDHTYEGVKNDFLMYSPLVSQNGIIAFHDIVPDNSTRYNIKTGGWGGGVSKFWGEIKDNYECFEFVNHPEQDGAGIGVIIKP